MVKARGLRFTGGGRRGLTFVEVLIAALLLVLVLFAALGLYERGAFTWSRTEKAAELQDQLRIAMNALGSDLRDARELIYLLGPPAEIEAGSVTGDTDLVELVVPRRAAPTALETIRYSWAPAGSGGTRYVLRRQGAGTPEPVAHDITYIYISPQGARLVEVVLRAGTEYRGRPLEAELRGAFYIRAAQ